MCPPQVQLKSFSYHLAQITRITSGKASTGKILNWPFWILKPNQELSPHRASPLLIWPLTYHLPLKAPRLHCPGPCPTPPVCFQTCLSTLHYHRARDSCLCPHLSSSLLLPLPPSCHLSVVSPDPSLPSLALALLPVRHTVLGSAPRSLGFISSGSPNSSIHKLLPFVPSNNWEAGKEKVVRSSCSLRSTGTPHAMAPVAWVTPLQNSKKEPLCSLQRKYLSSKRAPCPKLLWKQSW